MAQFVREHNATTTRSFHGGAVRIQRSFQSDAEAFGVFKQILDAAGLSGMEDRILLRASADVSNAAAFIEKTNKGEQRQFVNLVATTAAYA